MLRWRERYDLPHRLRPYVPLAVTEVLVALGMVALAVGGRLLIDQYFQDVPSFALIYPAVAVTTLLAGARAGLLVILLVQTLAWYFLLPIKGSFVFQDVGDALTLIVTTIAQLILLWSMAAFRQAAHRAAALEEDRAEGLELALRELTHRTKNNFQLAAALLNLHARRHRDRAVADELQAAAQRLLSIAAVHADTGMRGTAVTRIALDKYLADSCQRLREGLVRDGIVLEYRAEPIEVGHDCALQIGLIVNELVTNALKHAFRDRNGCIEISLCRNDQDIWLTVADDGPGMRGEKGKGLGGELIALLVRRLGGRLSRLDRPGTAFFITVPNCVMSG